MKTCTCPVATAIQEISTDACPYNFGQTQKAIIQRKFSTGVTRNTIADAATVGLLATWTALLAATDGTKAQITPFLAEPTLSPGAVKEYGSDNQVPNGIPITVGREHSTFECKFLGLSPAIAKELKALECEDLVVWLVNEEGQIGCVNPSTTLHQGIDIEQLFIGDREFGGFSEPDKVMMTFKLKPNWSDDLVFITPSDFNALTGLVN